MSYAARPLSEPVAAPPPGVVHLNILTYSYEERRFIVPAVAEALEQAGCWLLNRRPLSFTQIEYGFELELAVILELYAALIAAGLELTRASHEELTTLCTLRQHHDMQPTRLPSLLTVRLEISFLEELPSSPPARLSLAEA